MTSKLRSLRILIAACVFAVALSSIAVAAAKKTQTFSETGKANIIDTAGGTITTAGAGKDNRFGDSAFTVTSKLTGSTLNGKFVIYVAKGTFKGTVKLAVKTEANGDSQFSGPGKITGGTGAYTGATGTIVITATQPKDTTKPITLKATGKRTF
jgi:hypothetical protein